MPENPKKKLSWKAWAGIAGAVIVIGAIGNAVNGDNDPNATQPSYAAPTITPEQSKAAEEARAKKAEEKAAKKAAKESAKAEEQAKAEKEKAKKASTPEGRIALASEVEGVDVYTTPGSSGDIVFATFDISDNVTKKFIASGAKDNTMKILKAVQDSDIKYTKVFVQGNFPMQDKYGNTENSMILNAGYNKSTVDKINFDGINQSTIWDIKDSGMVHPELQG